MRRNFDLCVFCLGVLAASQVLVPLLTGSYDHRVAGEPLLIRVVWGVLYTAATIMVLLRRSWPSEAWRCVASIWLFVLFAAASVAWSVDPSLTLARWFHLFGTTMVGVHVGLAFSLQRQLEVLHKLLVSLTLASLLVGLLGLPFARFPDYGSENIWRGVFVHKNHLGLVASLAVGTTLVQYLVGTMRPRHAGVLLPLLLLTLFKAKSTTPMAGIAGSVAVGMAARILLRRGLTRGAAMLTMVIPVGIGVAAISVVSELILQALNKSPDLSGRDVVWSAVGGLIMRRPFLGYGFGALQSLPEFANVSVLLRHPVAHSHNGYLELAVSLGIPLAVVLTLVQLACLARSFQRLSRQDDGLWAIIVVLFGTLLNNGEVALFAQHRLTYILFLSTLVRLRLEQQTRTEMYQRWVTT